MRAIVTSSNKWSDEQTVIEAICELPAGTVVLLPTNSGACKTVRDHQDELKLEIEDWAYDDEDYESRGGSLNSEMIQSDIDICFAFVNKNSHTVKDLVRRARSMDLEVRVFEE
jgi:hypothetical protein